ncbi:kinase-like protein [Peniophora sp. CONT]|nr:kinase-like protein [Peniophora sp. CONT]
MNIPISTLQNALPLIQPLETVSFVAELEPITSAYEVTSHYRDDRFRLRESNRPRTLELVTSGGDVKCYFTWNGKPDFVSAVYSITRCSESATMINKKRLDLGVAKDLRNGDVIQIMDFLDSDYEEPGYCVKFFFRKTHVFFNPLAERIYTVIDKVGEGGFGSVHECRNPVGEQRVAIKVADATSGFPELEESFEVTMLRTFWENFQALYPVGWGQGLPSVDPHVVKLGAHWTVGSSQYLAMDLAVSDLEKKARRGTHSPTAMCLAEREVLSIARQVFTGLQYLHRFHYVHCDIKPSNILEFEEQELDGFPRMAIGDLGLCRPEDYLIETLSHRSDIFGTPGFQSPEILRLPRLWSPAVDIWATGITLYYAYTGTNGMFAGMTAAEIQHSLDSGVHWRRLELKGVSALGIAFLKRCLATDHLQRVTAEKALLDPWILQQAQVSGSYPFTPALNSNQPLPGPSRPVGQLLAAVAQVLQGEKHSLSTLSSTADTQERIRYQKRARRSHSQHPEAEVASDGQGKGEAQEVSDFVLGTDIYA